MRYNQPELIERLTGAYVLGTLSGAARRRLERLSVDSHAVRAAIRRWEERLNPLADRIVPVAPPAGVWAALERRIWPSDLAPARRGWGFWGGWAAAAAVLVAALVIHFAIPQRDPFPEHVAVIQEPPTGQPLWVVSLDLDRGTLNTRAVNAPARRFDRVFELWTLPPGAAPRSLGLLPLAGERQEYALNPALLEVMRGSVGLAVSVEPPGGSPTGLPTGPVVYQASLVGL